MKRVAIPPVVVPPTVAEPEARAIMQECFGIFRTKVRDLVKTALDNTDDLFQTTSTIPDGELSAFLNRRGEWIERFDAVFRQLFDQRLQGERRRGRRPDSDISVSSLKVLTAFDHEKQAALSKLSRTLYHFTRRETSALDLRVEALLGCESGRDLDSPFGVDYVLDAIGSTSRAVYPASRVWRPLMERLIADITPSFNNAYIAVNRVLADHGVLPQIKALLRARSEHRPADDRELLSTFTEFLHEAGQVLPTDVVVPALGPDTGAPPPLIFASSAPAVAASATTLGSGQPGGNQAAANVLPTQAILAGLTLLAAQHAERVASEAASVAKADEADLFPSVDPLMALYSSTPLFTTLGHWQRQDLPAAILRSSAQATADQTVVVPFNLIPHIRAAIAEQVANPADRVTMDVIALLFDYIFRDPSIPESLRQLFGRLQVPILKAALLDRAFFSDKAHPARLLLDHFADAAIGADDNHEYGVAIRELATSVVDELCRDFEIDLAAFARADQRVADFVELERERLKAATSKDIETARSIEAGDVDRAEVRNLVRERLAGLAVPFDVHSFIETNWADYLTMLRGRDGNDSPAYLDAIETIDNLLWSITAKERNAQKTRLAKMVPKLIGSLRKGVLAMHVEPARANLFFEAIYALHVAAISPRARVAGDASASLPAESASRVVDVHDFVGDIAVGTWVSFTVEDGATLAARLTWVSPLRGKYIFANHTPARILRFTAEELAYELGTGRAKVIVEPVPLFDRAVSTALDKLAAQSTPRPAQVGD